MIIIHRCAPAAGWSRPRQSLIWLVVLLSVLAVTAASIRPAWAQCPVSVTLPSLFSASYSGSTVTVSSVANASLLPGAIKFLSLTSSAGQSTSLNLTINPGSTLPS